MKFCANQTFFSVFINGEKIFQAQIRIKSNGNQKFKDSAHRGTSKSSWNNKTKSQVYFGFKN